MRPARVTPNQSSGLQLLKRLSHAQTAHRRFGHDGVESRIAMVSLIAGVPSERHQDGALSVRQHTRREIEYLIHELVTQRSAVTFLEGPACYTGSSHERSPRGIRPDVRG